MCVSDQMNHSPAQVFLLSTPPLLLSPLCQQLLPSSSFKTRLSFRLQLKPLIVLPVIFIFACSL